MRLLTVLKTVKHRYPKQFIVFLVVTCCLAVVGLPAAVLLHHDSPSPVQFPALKDVTKPLRHVAWQTTPSETTPSSPSPTAPKPKPTAPTLESVTAGINQKLQPYGVVASLQPPQNPSTYSSWSVLASSDLAGLQQFAAYLTEEFAKYPKDLVKNSGVQTIGLVKSLRVSSQARTAAPAPSISAMLYDSIALANAGSAYAREVVSHEYWHYLEYKTHGSYNYSDGNWSACNPSGFSYGSGGASAYNGSFTNTFHPQSGFITQYATYAIEEDRAELFGWLIYSPSSVKNLYPGDSRLQCKANRLTELVHQLSPAMAF